MKQSLKPLTSFRFIAAMMVFLHHLPNFKTDIDGIYFKNGYLGVEFFFVLSGFVLAYNYHDRINGNYLKEFYLARFARVYPLHLLTFFLAAILYVYDGHTTRALHSLAYGLVNIALLQAWVPKKHIYFSFNFPSWTISVEFFFYAIFPFIIMTVEKNKLIRRMSLLLIGLLWVSTLLMTLYFIQFGGSVSHEWLLCIFPISRLPEFIYGVLIFYIFKTKLPMTRNLATILEGLALIFIAGSIYMLLNLVTPFKSMDEVYFAPPVICLIYIFSFKKGLFSDFFSYPFAVLLGELSFAFYMLHYPIIWAMGLSKWFAHMPEFCGGAIAFCLTITLSYLTYNFYERPARAFIKSVY